MGRPDASGTYPGIHVEYFDKTHRYKVNGQYVPSVTTVLGVLDKPALPHWAANMTIEGVCKLAKRRGSVPTDPKRLKDALRKHRLSHYFRTEDAQDRGTDVHQVWEDWNERKIMPKLEDYPEDRHPHLRAMAAFILVYAPECLDTEMVVGSAKYGYAGRLDTVVTLKGLGGTLDLIDVKTGKAVYPNTMYPQLMAYEIARRECGLPPTDRQGILRLGADGLYELAWSDAEPDDFLSILACWRSQQKWKRRGKRR